MPDWWEEGYDEDAVNTLDDEGSYVEPDARDAIKKYLKAMGLTGYKKKFKKSELREAIRSALDVYAPDHHIDATRLKCPECGHDDVETWAEDGESATADWAECLRCRHVGRPEEFELDEQASTMGRMNFMSTADDEGQEILPEFADWAQGFQDSYDEKRYDIMAKQVFDDWPEHGPDVDWAKVVEMFVKNRQKNLHTEIDKDKLYEKLLSFVEDHYDGSVPPTVAISHPQYGAGSK